MEGLEDSAEKFRQQAQADSKIDDALAGLNALNIDMSKKGIDSLDDFSKLRDLKSVIKKHRAKSSAAWKEKADHALKVVDRLDKEIRSTVGISAGSSVRVS